MPCLVLIIWVTYFHGLVISFLLTASWHAGRCMQLWGEVKFDNLCDLLSWLSDNYSTHCLFGLLGGVCSHMIFFTWVTCLTVYLDCWADVRLCLIIYVIYFHRWVISILLTAYLACWAAYAAVRLCVIIYVTYFHSWVISILLTAYLACWAAYAAVRLCLIIYVTYFHGWVISILLTAYLACWVAYAAVRWGSFWLFMWPTFTGEWFLFYSLLTWLAGRLWGCVWLFMWPTFTDEWFLFYSLLTWLAGRRMRLWGCVWLFMWPTFTDEWFLFYSLLTWLAGWLWGCVWLFMWPTFTDEWFLFYSLLTWLAGRLWGCVWLFMWPTFTDEWFLFYSLLTWLAGRRMRLWGEVVFDYLCDLLSRMSDFYSTHCLLGLQGGCELVFDYLCDLHSRMSDFYSTHCLLGLLGGVCGCEVRMCVIMWPTFTDEWFLFYSLLTWLAGRRTRLWGEVVFGYMTYFHGWVISILLTAYLACWAAYAAVRWGCVWLFMWPTFTDEWFLFYSLLTWLAGRRMRLWGCVWLFMWPTFMVKW